MSLYIYADSGNILVGIICGGIPLLFVFRQWMAIDRTIVMNKHGCEVIFLWYKKKYKWNELELKKIVYFKNAWGNRNQYIKGAIFYKKNKLNFHGIKPMNYCVVFRPCSLICVNFLLENEPKGGYLYPHTYAVDEKIFLEKMDEWNVKMEYEIIK